MQIGNYLRWKRPEFETQFAAPELLVTPPHLESTGYCVA